MVIYYWTSGNTAEVEFIVQHRNRIIPVEVKSGNSVTAKSLSEYRKRYNPDVAIRLSIRNLHRDGNLLNVPLYLAERLKELVEWMGV